MLLTHLKLKVWLQGPDPDMANTVFLSTDMSSTTTSTEKKNNKRMPAQGAEFSVCSQRYLTLNSQQVEMDLSPDLVITSAEHQP